MTETSVVIAAFSGETALSACLRSLQPEAVEAETLVVGAFDAASLESLRHRHPWATFLAAPPRASVFALRALGVARASGRVVALLEDHCEVARGWLGALVAAVDGRGDLARGQGRFAGGAVESGGASIPAWALYLVEYGALMPPVGEDARGLLAVNAAYSRAALEACRSVWADGFHDNEVHDALHAAGHEPRLAGKATVTSHLRLSLARASGHLFSGGRRFGAYRWRRWAGGERLARILATPLVPMTMLARIFGRVLARRPATLPRMMAALPHLVCLLCAWSAGELVGHLAPSPREAVPE